MANSEDASEKTSIVTGDTLSGRLRGAEELPPALVVLIGPVGFVGKQWILSQSEYVIGRAVDCSIFLDDRSVSRNHAKLGVKEGQVSLIDLGSANKTSVNGQELNPMTPYELKNNDQVKTGNVIFKFLEKGNVESIANQQIAEKVLRDSLTGAYNRLALQEKGPEVIKRSEFLK
ncbi:MAG: FHA domain-containing protein, partial [Bdellovibrio sp.]